MPCLNSINQYLKIIGFNFSYSNNKKSSKTCCILCNYSEVRSFHDTVHCQTLEIIWAKKSVFKCAKAVKNRSKRGYKLLIPVTKTARHSFENQKD